MAEHKLLLDSFSLAFSFTFILSLQYILKLPPEARLELLKASVARKTGIPMTHVSVGVSVCGWWGASMKHKCRLGVGRVGWGGVMVGWVGWWG